MNAQELIEYCKREISAKELLALLARWAKREYTPARLEVPANKPVDRTEPKR